MNAHIYFVYAVHPHETEDKIEHELLGKFFLKAGHFVVLEDHGMAPGKDLSKMPAEEVANLIRSWSHSQRRIVASEEEVQAGHWPDLYERHLKHTQAAEKAGKAEPRTSKFSYHREGVPPGQLVVRGSDVFLDGQRLPPDEVARLHETIAEGKAQLRHEQVHGGVLAKIEPKLSEALAHLNRAVTQGHIPQEHARTIQATLFRDTMVPTVGNKLAYEDFLMRPRPGIHIHVDANDFGIINKIHGFEAGNEAIAAQFRAIREAADEAVGRKNAKCWRPGGDEGRVFVPTMEHAAAFCRALRTKLEAIPAVRGTHRLSVSVGYGPDPEVAESALIAAKGQKVAANKPKGQAETHVVGSHELPEQSSASGPGKVTPRT